MEAEAANALAERFVQFIETGQAPAGLFHPEAFLDYTMPVWRLQACGGDEVVRMRTTAHPAPGSVTRWRCDPTPTGFVIEFEERWEQDGARWYCREMARAEVAGDAIAEVSVYCTGDWDAQQEERHRREVTLLRP